MKYCTKCGKELIDEAVVCTNCGCATGDGAANTKIAHEADAPNTGWAILSFFIPLVGLILYLIYKDTTPLKAKSAGKGALIGFVTSIVVGIIWGVLAATVLADLFYDAYYWY